MAELNVQVVAPDHFIWSGRARMVRTKTALGDLGILPGHTPILALLASGELLIEPTDGGRLLWTVSGGFFSVDHDRVTVVADDVQTVAADAHLAPETRYPASR